MDFSSLSNETPTTPTALVTAPSFRLRALLRLTDSLCEKSRRPSVTRGQELSHAHIENASELYREGSALARLGTHLQAAPNTVRRALISNGVAILAPVGVGQRSNCHAFSTRTIKVSVDVADLLQD